MTDHHIPCLWHDGKDDENIKNLFSAFFGCVFILCDMKTEPERWRANKIWIEDCGSRSAVPSKIRSCLIFLGQYWNFLISHLLVFAQIGTSFVFNVKFLLVSICFCFQLWSSERSQMKSTRTEWSSTRPSSSWLGWWKPPGPKDSRSTSAPGGCCSPSPVTLETYKQVKKWKKHSAWW